MLEVIILKRPNSEFYNCLNSPGLFVTQSLGIYCYLSVSQFKNILLD